MALTRRVRLVASVLPLVVCVSPLLPRGGVFFPSTAPNSEVHRSALSNARGLPSFLFSLASATPTAAPSEGVATGKDRAERLLKYAEQRAENAEEELKRFRQTHESSVRACGEASQRKQRELDTCQEQNESFRQMYNTLQVTKSTLEREVHSLQSQLAAANAAAAAGAEASADRDAAAKEEEVKQLRATVKKLEDKLQDAEEQNAADVAALQGKIRELLMQRELLRQQREGMGGSGIDGERYLTSLHAIKTVLMDVGKLYYAIGEQLLTLIPARWWDSAASMKMEAEMLAAPYVNKVYEQVGVPLIPYVESSKAFFFSRVYPLCIAVGNRTVTAAKTLSDDVMPAVNRRLDAALKPIFSKHPEVEVLVPSGFGDRLAVFIFIVLITYVVALFSFRCVLFPVARAIFPCGKRRTNVSSSKRTRTGNTGSNAGGSQQKRFIPSAVAGNAADMTAVTYNTPAQGGGVGNKKGHPHSHTPVRPFPFADKYENAPVNLKKV